MSRKTTASVPADPFGARRTLRTRAGEVTLYSLEALERRGLGEVARLPYSIKVMLESVLRPAAGGGDGGPGEEDLARLLRWTDPKSREQDVPFRPARVLMQDFTGVPAVADLAVMRDTLGGLGGDPAAVNPLIPVDLVIDHSVQVDRYASPDALAVNTGLEFRRNRERYELLRWASRSFDGFRVVPPATGICHQVNLEYLARVVQTRPRGGATEAFPDSLVGTDSHTTMINGIGVFGFGVGGIEAEAVMLGQPLYMRVPEVLGVRLTGALPPGTTATDLVLVITQRLRARGVVDKVVEFFGPGLASLTVADRATVSNMCPEYGATAALFPVDAQTLSYLASTGRGADRIDLIERYCREQGLFREEGGPEPAYAEVLELDLGGVEACLAGPRRPQDRVPLPAARESWRKAAGAISAPGRLEIGGREVPLGPGSVVIAAITSCTNTSNPSVMIGAGLLARKAVERGLAVPPTVKTSLAPGSRVVTRYLANAGLLPALEALGFHVVGYGCTTCIGNSGPLHPQVSRAVREHDLPVAAVLSGNRNFEGRIHPQVRLNYLASPPLVVAYALAGTMDIDLTREPLGTGRDGRPVYLSEIWPTPREIEETARRVLEPKLFDEEYARVFTGDDAWNAVPVTGGKRYPWDGGSTYIRRPPFFEGLLRESRGGAGGAAPAGGVPPAAPSAESGSAAFRADARVLALLGDSITTDHISPAGDIPADSPAGRWLLEHGVPVEEFNSYGARRGNHEVMVRGTFANIRIRNRLAPGTEGGWTLHLPSGRKMSIFEAAQEYARAGTPLLVIAGKEYGAGSSRDWAAKGAALLGVRAVIAESFERIHRSNLIGMGVLPLQFAPGQGAASLELTGREVYRIEPLERPRQSLRVTAAGEDRTKEFTVTARLDTPLELDTWRGGGILPAALRRLRG